MIQLNKVRISFEDQEVLKGIDLRVEKGETRVILGPSGCGKSVTLKILLGLLKPDSGTVVIDGQDITNMNEDQLNEVREKMGMVFQGGALFDSMTVRENVAFKLTELRTIEPEEIDRIVEEKLRYVDLEEAIDMMPADLSGGMKKRVAIARAITGNPSILFYDEPTTGLDPITAKQINKLIIKLAKEGVTSIIVTHELDSAFMVADTISMIKEGNIIFEGTVEELKNAQDSWIREYLS
ncbi:MAG: ABC transporter ATP-binding protein [Candidatus Glassbacteria bacterium]